MMGGESASPQPGGREPAPGALGLVQAFINTHYDLVREHGAEVLSSPRALGAWLGERGLLEAPARATQVDLERALQMREALRALARDSDGRGDVSGPLAALSATAAGASVEVRFASNGPAFVQGHGAGVRGALGVLLAVVATAMIDGSWARLKICPGRDCGWAFYDNSRNRTGRWCSMSVCGGREKARAHYQRRRGRD